MEGIGLVVLLNCIPSPPKEASLPSVFSKITFENKFIAIEYSGRYGS